MARAQQGKPTAEVIESKRDKSMFEAMSSTAFAQFLVVVVNAVCNTVRSLPDSTGSEQGRNPIARSCIFLHFLGASADQRGASWMSTAGTDRHWLACADAGF